ncbi:hypothetical protein OG21DRAFT_1528015 [Imleria badia]|nr:hypothetical protein OG21DRAFT_1528015 [Imleria badia]
MAQPALPGHVNAAQIQMPASGHHLTANSRFTNQAAPVNENQPTGATTSSLPSSGLAVPNKSNHSTKTPHQLTKAPHQHTESSAPASDITPQASVASSPATKRPMKTDLPMGLLINGGNDDVWSVSRICVAYALPLMVDYHPGGLDLSMMDFSWHSPIVSMCALSDLEVRDMADMLLKGSTFLYTDLDSSSPKKAFHSHFMLQLLHVLHLQYVTGALQSVLCIDPPMHNHTGVIDLCGVALEHVLCLASNGHITIVMLQAFKGNNNPKMPTKLNEHTGRDSNMAFVFSDQNWGEATRMLTTRVQKRTASEITSIVDAAQKALLPMASKSEVSASSSAPVISVYMSICKSYCFGVLF